MKLFKAILLSFLITIPVIASSPIILYYNNSSNQFYIHKCGQFYDILGQKVDSQDITKLIIVRKTTYTKACD